MTKVKTFLMSATSDEKGRGSCCSLEAVKHFLQSGTIPEGYTKNDKRALRRRARSFVLIKNELYFTGGRSRHNKGLIEVEKDGVENPEDEPDHTQMLRKVLFSAEEQQEAVDKAHIAEDGKFTTPTACLVYVATFTFFKLLKSEATTFHKSNLDSVTRQSANNIKETLHASSADVSTVSTVGRTRKF